MPTTPELFDMSDRVAVVTGGGRGIGAGIAQVFAECGAAVVVAARRTNEIEEVAAGIRSAGGPSHCPHDRRHRRPRGRSARASGR